jgi:hypothetical protein
MGQVIMMTEAQLKRTVRDWSEIAGELVEVRELGGAIYAYGSELATLRLFRKMPSKRQGYSENLKTFYFCVEIQ